MAIDYGSLLLAFVLRWCILRRGHRSQPCIGRIPCIVTDSGVPIPRLANPHVRQALLESSRAEFAQKGLLGAAELDGISRSAGSSAGAFYSHVETNDLSFTLCSRCW